MKRKSFASGAGIMLLIGGAIGVFLTLEPSGSEPLGAEEVTSKDAEAAIDQTVLAAFSAEYRAFEDKFHAREIYEKYFETLGVTGLVQGINAVRPRCHDEGHDLGKIIYSREQDVGVALDICQDACQSGCMHGVLMERFAAAVDVASPGGEHITLDEIQNEMESICADPGMMDIYKPGDCAHGVGHAIMFLTEYQVEQSMEYCSLFSTYPMDYYCATGAYMEYATTLAQSNLQTNPLLFPCDQAEYPAACFRYHLVQVMLWLNQQDLSVDTAVKACLALNGKFEVGCFHGLGNAFMPYLAMDKITIDKVCSFGDTADQTACIDGAVERLSKFYPEVGSGVCDDLSDWRRDVCLEASARQMYSLTKSFDLYPR